MLPAFTKLCEHLYRDFLPGGQYESVDKESVTYVPQTSLRHCPTLTLGIKTSSKRPRVSWQSLHGVRIGFHSIKRMKDPTCNIDPWTNILAVSGSDRR